MKADFDFSHEIDEIVDRLFKKLKPLLEDNCTARVNENLFDVKGLCTYLSVSEQWVYNKVHLKEIPHLKIKGLLRFIKKDIDKWLNSYNCPVVARSEKILKAIKRR